MYQEVGFFLAKKWCFCVFFMCNNFANNGRNTVVNRMNEEVIYKMKN